MANKEFEESELQSAAKALGCEECLPKNRHPEQQSSSLKENLSIQDKYIQDAMHGSVSFLPDEPAVEKVSYAELLRQPSKLSRSINGWNGRGNQPRNMMTKRPGYDRD